MSFRVASLLRVIEIPDEVVDIAYAHFTIFVDIISAVKPVGIVLTKYRPVQVKNVGGTDPIVEIDIALLVGIGEKLGDNHFGFVTLGGLEIGSARWKLVAAIGGYEKVSFVVPVFGRIVPCAYRIEIQLLYRVAYERTMVIVRI